MEVKTHLFDVFPETTKEQWIQQVVKDLKGGDFKEILNYTTPDGLVIQPFYTAEDLVQGTGYKPLFAHTDWEICEEIDLPDTAAANQKALQALNNGATGLVFHVTADVALPALLQDIGIEYICLQFAVKGDITHFNTQLAAYLSAKKLTAARLNMSVCFDPLSALVATGSWDQAAAKQAFLNHISTTKGSRNLCINGPLYHNAGAAPAYEIACIAAHANEYLNWLDEPAGQLQINIATGPDYFFEIAKLRALRKVFALLNETYGNSTELFIHAETAMRNLTLYDAHNNLLRTTTEAMAATIGGCNSLVVKPFDIVYQKSDPFSDRLARNIQLILKAESYFDKVSDVAAGSFFIETLTEQLAEKAWDYFKEIEAKGGFISCLEQGSIQQTIEDMAGRQQQAFAAGKEVLVGSNKFPDLNQKMGDKAAALLQPRPSAAGTNVKPLNDDRLSLQLESERLKNETAVH